MSYPSVYIFSVKSKFETKIVCVIETSEEEAFEKVKIEHWSKTIELENSISTSELTDVITLFEM